MKTPHEITAFPVAEIQGERQSYAFLKMFFQQEKLPQELFIETKNVRVKDVKKLALHYISTYDYLARKDKSVLMKRSAMTAMYWLETLYREVIKNRKNRLNLTK